MATASAKDHDLMVRVLTIGNSGVGKTCLLIRFSEDKFSPTYITTIGVDFKTKIIGVHDKRVKMQVNLRLVQR